MDSRFTSMDAGDRSALGGGGVCVRRAVAAAGALAAAACGAVSSCLSGLRRPQFDEEHQQSLLSCHMSDELGGGVELPGCAPVAGPEAAMLELRRRVMMGGAAGPSRWKQRRLQAKAEAAAKPLARAREKQDEPRRSSGTAEGEDAAARLSETTLALDELLGALPSCDARAGVCLEDVRRLSVDELLALAPPAPEKTGGNPEETDAAEGGDEARLSKDGAGLRAWLAGIDAPRAREYRAYAAAMERLGFQSLSDLAQLDERDVETAMSEVGVAKFAHRLRLRKAIRELHLGLRGVSAVAPIPAAVAAA